MANLLIEKRRLNGESCGALDCPSLRRGARGEWLRKLSHPEQFGEPGMPVSCIRQLRRAFAMRRARPLVLVRGDQWPVRSWVHEVSCEDTIVTGTVHGRGDSDPDRRIIDLDGQVLEGLLCGTDEDRMVVFLDEHIRYRGSIRYRLGTTRDPREALAMLERLRNRAQVSPDDDAVARAGHGVQQFGR